MANLVFREISSGISGRDDIWLRSTPASTIVNNEFYGINPSTVSGYIKYWTGSAWVVKPVKYWDGSAWVQKPLKYWNGSAWTLTVYTP